MAIALTETATFDATVVVPEDSVDDETAASLVPAFQSLADRTRALKFTLDLLTLGGSAPMTSTLSLSTPASSTVNVNDLTAASHADGGLVTAGGLSGFAVTRAATVGTNLTVGSVANIGVGTGGYINTPRVHTPRAVVLGGVSGTNVYNSIDTDHVFAPVGSLTSGVVWQIGNLPSGTDNNTIRFVNDDTTAVTIKNPASATLITLQRSAGQVYAVTFAYLSGSWRYIDYSSVPT